MNDAKDGNHLTLLGVIKDIYSVNVDIYHVMSFVIRLLAYVILALKYAISINILVFSMLIYLKDQIKESYSSKSDQYFYVKNILFV